MGEAVEVKLAPGEFVVSRGAVAKLARKLGHTEDELVALAPLNITAEQRRKYKHTFDHDSFPTDNLDLLDRAIKSYGRCPEDRRPALKRYLTAAASRLNAPQEMRDRISKLGEG